MSAEMDMHARKHPCSPGAHQIIIAETENLGMHIGQFLREIHKGCRLQKTRKIRIVARNDKIL